MQTEDDEKQKWISVISTRHISDQNGSFAVLLLQLQHQFQKKQEEESMCFTERQPRLGIRSFTVAFASGNRPNQRPQTVFTPWDLGCGARQMELSYAFDLRTVCPCINILNYG
mgnify:CR=1 FL=1